MKSMKSLVLAGSALSFAMLPTMASAQDGGTGDQPQAKSGGLAEIVVTAQKREEKLLDVPISITAVNAEQLEARGITSAAGLSGLAPNLFYRSNPGSSLIPTIGIRGSIASQPAIWADPAVGMYIDGIYLGKSQGSVFDIVDLQRVEVLRGPQGTLFGRNTEGGAINFITRKPSGEFKGKASAEYGEYNRKVFGLSVDLPQISIASVSLAIRKEDQDGWIKNANAQNPGAKDRLSLRGAVRLDLADNLTADYVYDYTKVRDTPNPTSLYALSGWRGTFPTLFGAAAGTAIQNALEPYVSTSRPSRIDSNSGYPLISNLNASGHALTLDYHPTDNLELKYIFSHRKSHYNDSGDLDGSPLNSVALTPTVNLGLQNYFNRNTHYKQTSHELQVLGSALNDNLKYVLGFYHFTDDGDTYGSQFFALFSTPPVASAYGSSTKAQAVYGQIDYTWDRLTATIGLRYTHERKSGWTHRFNTNGFDGPFLSEIFPYIEYSAKFHGTTPMAALSYKVTDDINIYARVARGFKSGGFSSELSDPRVVNPYKPQKSLSMELGVKSRLFDNRAMLNLTYFRNRISDQQLSQLLPASTQSFIANAGKSTYQGIEIEAMAKIMDGWTVQLGYGYLHTKFNKFMDNALNIPGRPLIDTASNKLAPYAPKHSLNLNVDGELWEGDFGRLHLIGDYTYVAKTYLYSVNKSLTAPNAGGSYVASLDGMPSLSTLNLRLALSDIPVGPGKAEISLFVKNVTNESKMIQGIDFGMYRTANWNDPRTVTGTISYKW